MWLLNFIIVATLFTLPCHSFDLGQWMSWCSDSRMNTGDAAARRIAPDCEDKLAAAEKLIEKLTQQMMEKDSEIDLLKTQLTDKEEHLTRVRRQGGLPVCEANLAACQAQVQTLTGQLSTCNQGLTTCTNNLNSCTTTSNACATNLATCTATSQTCAGNLATCSTQLSTCNTNLNACRASNTGTCAQDLINCRSQLSTCRGSCANQLGLFTFTKLSSGTYLFATTQLNWYGARDYCRKYGMELTSIGSEAEALAIRNELNTRSLGSQSLYWTGINNLGGTLSSVGTGGGRSFTKLAILMAMLSNYNSGNNGNNDKLPIFDKLPGQCIAFSSSGQIGSFRLQPSDCNHLGQFICRLPAHCVV